MMANKTFSKEGNYAHPTIPHKYTHCIHIQTNTSSLHFQQNLPKDKTLRKYRLVFGFGDNGQRDKRKDI